MIIEVSTEVSLPVILIDESDFKTELTGIASSDMSISYSAPDTFEWNLKSVDEWNELGNGLYLITFSASEIGSFAGEFLYYAKASNGSTSLPFWGSAQIVLKSLDSLESQLRILEFLFATLAGHGLHIAAKDPGSFILLLQEAKKSISNLPAAYQPMAARSISFFQSNFGPLRQKKD